MWVADLLTVFGLLLDVFGAVLLIGIEWRWTLKVGQAMNPELKRLEAGLDTLNEGEDLDEGDAGFEELFDVFEDAFEGNQRYWLGGLHPWDLSRIKAPEDVRGKVVFVFESENPLFGKDSPMEVPARISLVRDQVNQHAQGWFIRRAVLILVIGFGLQIVATVAPYLGGIADMVVDVVVDALKLF